LKSETYFVVEDSSLSTSLKAKGFFRPDFALNIAEGMAISSMLSVVVRA
jgi:hypothetical protein